MQLLSCLRVASCGCLQRGSLTFQQSAGIHGSRMPTARRVRQGTSLPAGKRPETKGKAEQLTAHVSAARHMRQGTPSSLGAMTHTSESASVFSPSSG